jgi:hypothetical protein
MIVQYYSIDKWIWVIENQWNVFFKLSKKLFTPQANEDMKIQKKRKWFFLLIKIEVEHAAIETKEWSYYNCDRDERTVLDKGY